MNTSKEEAWQSVGAPVGFDVNPKYIECARTHFPQAQFVCARVSQYRLAEQEGFDAVLAIGILHHLDDEEARQLFQIAYDALRTGGKLVTMDGVRTADQPAAVRWLLEKDRGKYEGRSRVFEDRISGVLENKIS